jgi:hypothetical protein
MLSDTSSHSTSATVGETLAAHHTHERTVYERLQGPGRRRPFRLVIAALIVVLTIATVQVWAGISNAGDILVVRIEAQQATIVDPRVATPRGPYVLGVNVFPAQGTRALDGAYGFMSYDAKTLNALRGASITMLRFPGGDWGEQHTLSSAQINAFLSLSQQTHATPLMQVRLAGDTPQQAARLVSYCNNPHDAARQQYPNVPFVPVHYWVIGNEPDLRGSNYTVDSYVHDFVAFATAMLAVDPSIQIYGPELSQYNGPEASPRDSHGVAWMDGFLQGIAAYERQTHTHILSGISLHRYPFSGSIESSSLLFSSAQEWRYTIPLLRDQIQSAFGADLPIAVTEINTSPLGAGTANRYATALWWADTLGALTEQGVSAVDFFSARGLEQPYSLLTTSGDVTPLYRVMQLYAAMAPNVVPVGDGSAAVRLYAASSSDHNTLTLMLINESSHTVAVTAESQQFGGGWGSTRINLPAYAIACVILRHGASGQLLLYAPSSATLEAGQAGEIVTRSLP